MHVCIVDPPSHFVHSQLTQILSYWFFLLNVRSEWHTEWHITQLTQILNPDIIILSDIFSFLPPWLLLVMLTYKIQSTIIICTQCLKDTSTIVYKLFWSILNNFRWIPLIGLLPVEGVIINVAVQYIVWKSSPSSTRRRRAITLSYCTRDSLSIHSSLYSNQNTNLCFHFGQLVILAKRHPSNNTVSKTAASSTLFVANTSPWFYTSHIIFSNPSQNSSIVSLLTISKKIHEKLHIELDSIADVCFTLFYIPLTKTGMGLWE